ncbi:UDP-N-acetylenolpyruvoylglucosamine reductase [Thermosipho sp. 1063]|uniref:UDP-N-acetylmuramate dehydrogenase n=1 Tax=unclassified Thermosipho (in: thermotogales) TaxID=2676525 RepID=UPI000949241B|nr:UDP-N-acetylenolpyruvoylglucosamine reductase [Thermosipho sp. 1070]APT72827.1 UDP-N-acetylenolpyruvoylglucosamine reductase [Thermosipho sp. 1063]
MKYLKKIINILLELGNDVHTNEKLKCHVSFRIGGPVRLFVVPYSLESFVKTIKLFEGNVRILGNGTNVLPKDDFMDYNILSTEKLTEIVFEKDLLVCESGLNLKRLCLYALQHGFSGFEKSYGIPGSVGGAVYMNAGAFGWETANLVEFVDVYDGNKIRRLSKSELDFSYRNSIFKKNKGLFILRVGFKIFEGDKQKIFLEMNDIIKKRVEKQPLEFPSAGSVFKRPKENFYVGSAIEKIGLKGFKIGGAMISEKHAGFIINYNNATSKDVKDIINHVKNKIYEAYKVNLETEIEIW